MATLAISALGAGIGGATGIGANVGWIVGGIVGSLLFPPDPVRTEGPRLGDLSVSSSAYGAPRAIGYGTVRMGGNVIWALPIREEKKTEKSGGKGGAPAQEMVTYAYYGTFAVAFGEGLATEVLRIWADADVIFDKRADPYLSTGAYGFKGLSRPTKQEGVKFRFYPGSSTQEADSAIIAEQGVANTPAHRDTVYIVFDDIPLENYGNRLPNITAEIAYTSIYNDRFQEVSTPLDGAALTNFDTNYIAVDWERGYAYYLEEGTSDGGIGRVNMNQIKQDREIIASSILPTGGGTPSFGATSIMVVDPIGGGLITNYLPNSVAANSLPIAYLDATSFQATATFGAAGSGTAHSTTNIPALEFAAVIITGNNLASFLLTGSATGASFGVHRLPDLTYVWDSETFLGGTDDVRIRGMTGGDIGEDGEGWVLTGGTYTSPSTGSLDLFRIRLSPAAAYELQGGDATLLGGFVEQVATITPDDLISGETTFNDVGPMVYDHTDGNLIIGVTKSNSAHVWVKWNTTTNSRVWVTAEVTVPPGSGAPNSFGTSWVSDNLFGYVAAADGTLIDTIDGTLIFDGVSPSWATADSMNGNGVYDAISNSFVSLTAVTGSTGPMVRYFFDRVNANGVTLDEIVGDLSARTGLTAADLDVSDLATTEVPGYFVGRQSTARAAIEPLAQLYLFDGFESDFKLKYKFRGQDPARAITESELAVVDTTSGDVMKENRIQEVELPLNFSLVYMDTDNDYQQNTHSARRVKEPNASMFSSNEFGLQINIVLEATTAKRQAEQLLYSAWVERINYDMRWSWDHIDLEPSDVVTVTLDSGTEYQCRIASFDVGEGLMIDVNAIGDKPALFSSTTTADAGQGWRANVIPSTSFVKAVIADVPLLRDVDEPAGRTVNPTYYFMGGFNDGDFVRGQLFYSADNVAFEWQGAITSGMAWGSTTAALPDPPWDNPHATDNVSTLNVTMNVGGADLVSVTNSEMLNGANAAMLIKANGEIEVINFQNVTQESDGTFTLDTFLRGRRGTDTMSFDHGAGETFVILNLATAEIVNLTLADLDTAVYFATLGGGQAFPEAQRTSLTSNHRALMPYAPHAATAIEDGSNNIDFAWERRTRVGGPLLDEYGTVPLNEDSEEYEIEIYDGPGGSLLRTATGLTSPDYEYTNANIVTDFGSVPTTITVKIFQVSAQAGRGFSREVSIDVE